MRKLLPLLNSHPGGRSAMTCRFRCGDACFHETPNTSENEYSGDIIATALSRRSIMRTAAVVTVAATAGTAFVAGSGNTPASATPSPGATTATARAARSPTGRVACASRRSRPTPPTR